MPKSHRDLLKRQLAHAYHNLDLAGYHLGEVIKAFEPIHPELKPILEAVQSGLLIQMEALTKFAFTAWGNPSPDWDAWRNEPDPKHVTRRIPIEHKAE